VIKIHWHGYLKSWFVSTEDLKSSFRMCIWSIKRLNLLQTSVDSLGTIHSDCSLSLSLLLELLVVFIFVRFC
jgi:hypothetical protein